MNIGYCGILMLMDKCTVQGCNRSIVARGLCHGHYKRWQLGKPLEGSLRQMTPGGRICVVTGCEKRAVSGGLCSTHLDRRNRGLSLSTPVHTYIRTDDLEKRLRHYAPVGAPDKCWEWTGCVNKGQGMISVARSKARGAHIVAWEIANGEPANGRIVRHICDNAICTNPAHLLIGTHANNVADKVERGRQSKGHSHGLAKLSSEEVVEIRRLLAKGVRQKDIAEIFGITQPNVSLIKNRKGWTHI